MSSRMHSAASARVCSSLRASRRLATFCRYSSASSGVQSRHRRGRCFQLTEEIASPGFQSRHLVLYGGARNARFDSFDQPAGLAFDLLQIARGAVAAPIMFGRLPVHFSVKFVNECPDHFWVHQLMPEPIQDLGFQLVSPQGQQIVTGSLVSGGGATVVGLTDFREPATADSAFEKAGEKITRSASTLRAYAFVFGHDARPGVPLALLDQVPEMVVKNAKVRHALDDPFGFRVWPRLAPTGIWILNELLTVPDQSTNIQLVVENPRAAPPVAVDRGGPPGLAGGTGDGLLVKAPAIALGERPFANSSKTRRTIAASV